MGRARFLGLLCAAVGAAGAAEFYVDWAVFYEPPAEAARLEVYFGVPLRELMAAGGEDAAAYDFTVGAQLTGAADGAVVAREVVHKKATLTVGSGEKTPLSVGQLNFRVTPGEYLVTLGVGDLVSGQPYIAETRVVVPPAPAAAFLSGVEVASVAADAMGATEGEFLKNGLNVVPNPTKIIPAAPDALTIYYEIYDPAGGGGERAYKMRYEIAQLNGRRFLQEERSVAAAAPTTARVETFDVGGFPPGRYALKLTLVSQAGEELAQGLKEFVIYQEYAPAGLLSFQEKYRPYSAEEESRVRKEIGLIATPEEMAAFDALPLEEKPIFVEHFWRRRDPDPTTPANELKNAFYERYQYVQEHYSTPFREGVDTDRGRVYLKYGQPDLVITSPMGLPSQVGIDTSSWQSDPFEAWEYHVAGGVDNQYILFVFVDFDGDGSYEIDASTVPGYGKLIRSIGPQTGG